MKVVISTASQGAWAYAYITQNLIKPLAKCVSISCQARHDCFHAGTNYTMSGQSATSIEFYQKNSTGSAYINPYITTVITGVVS